MKKLILSLLTMAALFFIGCSKDGQSQKERLDDRLVGTIWQCDDNLYEIFWGGVAYDVYEFTTDTKVERYTLHNGNVASPDGEFNYTLDYPNLIIHEINSDEEATDLTFIFENSRTMVRTGLSEDSYHPYDEYIKQ